MNKLEKQIIAEDGIANKPPHFLIVGAPKAGTTSLYRYLQQHPKIFMPENKEPRYFCGYSKDDFGFGTKNYHPEIVSKKEDYLELFRESQEDAICGEASTDYLSCHFAASRIYDWNQAVKIIIMLRNPVDRAFSEYQHSVTGKFQTNTFWESLCLEKERYENHYDPIFWHVRRGLYFEAVKEFIELFGKDRVHIIFFEEFVSSTVSVVETLFEFLEVESYPVDVSKRHNPGLKQSPNIFQEVLSAKYILPIVKSLGKKISIKTKEDIIKLFPRNKKSGARAMLTNNQYNWLREKFRDDILKLQVLLDVNLSHWL